MKEHDFFRDTQNSFSKVIVRLRKMSSDLHGKKVTPRGLWVCALLYRLVSNGNTVNLICGRKQELDHFAIATLSRSIIETGLMLLYITDASNTEDAWRLRRDVLFLHDCISRLRIFKSISVGEEVDKLRSAFEELKQRIKSNTCYESLEESQKTDLLSGRVLYINGPRAVARSAGFTNEWFEMFQVTLSAFVHATPYSFGEQEDRRIWEGNSPYAHGVAATSLSLVVQMMEQVITHYDKILSVTLWTAEHEKRN